MATATPGVLKTPTRMTLQPTAASPEATAASIIGPDCRESRPSATVGGWVSSLPGRRLVQSQEPKAAPKRAATVGVRDWPTSPRMPEIESMSGAIWRFGEV